MDKGGKSKKNLHTRIQANGQEYHLGHPIVNGLHMFQIKLVEIEQILVKILSYQWTRS